MPFSAQTVAGPRLLLRALSAWLITAVALLVLFSFVLSRVGTGSAVLGYLSSFVSFCAAFSAGCSFRRHGQGKRALPSLALALGLVILLLSVGLRIGGRPLDPSGILSVVSFTVVGVAAGSLLFPLCGKASRKASHKSARKRRPIAALRR